MGDTGAGSGAVIGRDTKAQRHRGTEREGEKSRYEDRE